MFQSVVSSVVDMNVGGSVLGVIPNALMVIHSQLKRSDTCGESSRRS